MLSSSGLTVASRALGSTLWRTYARKVPYVLLNTYMCALYVASFLLYILIYKHTAI